MKFGLLLLSGWMLILSPALIWTSEVVRSTAAAQISEQTKLRQNGGTDYAPQFLRMQDAVNRQVEVYGKRKMNFADGPETESVAVAQAKRDLGIDLFEGIYFRRLIDAYFFAASTEETAIADKLLRWAISKNLVESSDACLSMNLCIRSDVVLIEDQIHPAIIGEWIEENYLEPAAMAMQQGNYDSAEYLWSAASDFVWKLDLPAGSEVNDTIDEAIIASALLKEISAYGIEIEAPAYIAVASLARGATLDRRPSIIELPGPIVVFNSILECRREGNFEAAYMLSLNREKSALTDTFRELMAFSGALALAEYRLAENQQTEFEGLKPEPTQVSQQQAGKQNSTRLNCTNFVGTSEQTWSASVTDLDVQLKAQTEKLTRAGYASDIAELAQDK